MRRRAGSSARPGPTSAGQQPRPGCSVSNRCRSHPMPPRAHTRGDSGGPPARPPGNAGIGDSAAVVQDPFAGALEDALGERITVRSPCCADRPGGLIHTLARGREARRGIFSRRAPGRQVRPAAPPQPASHATVASPAKVITSEAMT